MTTHRGSCLCGGVGFTVEGPLPPADACHCIACRKSTGHFFVSSDVKKTALTFQTDETLAWYASSEKVRRGFCGRCGSTLFFDAVREDWIGVALGALDGPTETQVHLHTFVSEKGDYYELDDGVPQNEH